MKSVGTELSIGLELTTATVRYEGAIYPSFSWILVNQLSLQPTSEKNNVQYFLNFQNTEHNMIFKIYLLHTYVPYISTISACDVFMNKDLYVHF